MCAKLKSISLENFRIFREKEKFNFKNINIITGANNSGKSSIIKALLLLKDNVKNGWENLQFNSEHHNLSDFESCINDVNYKQTFEICIELEAMDDIVHGGYINYSDETVSGQLISSVCLSYEKSNSGGAQLKHASLVTTNQFTILRYSLTSNQPEITYHIDPSWINPNIFSDQEIKDILNLRVSIPYDAGFGLENASNFINTILTYKDQAFISIFDLASVPARTSTLISTISTSDALDINTLSLLAEEPFILSYIKKLNVSGLFDTVNKNRKIFLFKDHGDIVKLFGKTKEFESYGLDLGFMNHWLGKNGFNIMEGIDTIQTIRIPGVGVELNFIRDNSIIDLSTLGTGSSNLFYMLMTLYCSSRDETLYFEEPEVYLHPNFQSKLADLFVACTQEPFDLQIIIETHSEYLIRKLQYLVAKKSLRSDNIQIYYMDASSNPKAKNMNIQPQGYFMEDFGPGFLDESIKLKVDLLNTKREN